MVLPGRLKARGLLIPKEGTLNPSLWLDQGSCEMAIEVSIFSLSAPKKFGMAHTYWKDT